MSTEKSICMKCHATIDVGSGGMACPKCGGAHLSRGARIGPYRLIRLLTSSGAGGVHLAWNEESETSVALKIFFEMSEREEKRFRRQAKLIAGLKHPNILPILDFGTLVGEFVRLGYIATQFIDGFTLDLAPGSIHRKIEICADVAEALHYAHAEQVVHRDVKPGNILVDRSGHAYLTDFGLAKSTKESTSSVTVTGSILGTPHFMSPEQARGERTIGPASDIFSLGATLYAVVTGHLPYEQQRSSMQVIRTAATAPAPKPSRVMPNIHPDLEQIIMSAMAQKHRTESASVLAEQLRAFLRGKKAPARTSTGPASPSPAVQDREAEVPLEEVEKLLALYECTNRQVKDEEVSKIRAGIKAAQTTAPDHYRALICKGRLEQVLGNDEEALNCFTRATELRPDLSSAFGHRVEILIRRYQRARWIPLIYLGPGALVRAWRRETDEQHELRSAITGDIRNMRGKENARALWGEGVTDLHEGRYGQALSKLEEVVEDLPLVAEAWVSLGMTRILLHDYPAARDALARANSLRATPLGLQTESKAHGLIGMELKAEGQDPLPHLEAAMAPAERAARMAPDHPEIRRNHVVMLRLLLIERQDQGKAKREEFEGLLGEAEALVRDLPEEPPPRYVLASVLMFMPGTTAERRACYERSMEVNREVLQIDPTFLASKNAIATAMIDMGDMLKDPDLYKKALKELEPIGDGDEVAAEVFGSRARAFHALGRTDEAREWLRKGLQRQPEMIPSPDLVELHREVTGGGSA